MTGTGSCAPKAIAGTSAAGGTLAQVTAAPSAVTGPNVPLTMEDVTSGMVDEVITAPAGGTGVVSNAPTGAVTVPNATVNGTTGTPTSVPAMTGPPTDVESITGSLGGPPTELVRPEATALLGGRSAPAEPMVVASSRPPAAAGPRAHPVRAGLPGGPPVPVPGPGNSTPDQRSPQAAPPEQTVVERSGPGQPHSSGEPHTLPVDGYALPPPSRAARSAVSGRAVRSSADEPAIPPD